MASYGYLILDVFTDKPFAGNPLAVLPDAHGLDGPAMQKIAAEFNLSETVFIFPREDDPRAYDLRIMTPRVELPFAGHPTIGAAVALALRGLRGQEDETLALTLAPPLGEVPVEVRPLGPDHGRASCDVPKMPEPLPLCCDAKTAAALLGLPAEAIAGTGPSAWSAGIPFLMIPLADETALAAARVDGALWRQVLAGSVAPHLYAYLLDPHQPGEVQSRMFAPAMGIAEDPATGGAAAAFAGEYAAALGLDDGQAAFTIRQGEAMGRPSRLEVGLKIAGGEVTRVSLGGEAVILGEGELKLPNVDFCDG